jgi:hypothetical protein
MSGYLLGFLVSKTRIMVDPLKVEEIIRFPTLRTKGSMHLLKNDTPFIWDE